MPFRVLGEQHAPFLQERCEVTITPRVMQILLENPLTRVGFYWVEELGREGGLSPFGYAGITGNSPRKVMEQLEKEPYFYDIGFCWTTKLPIAFLYEAGPAYIAKRRHDELPNNYDDPSAEDPDDLPTLEEMLESYGGRDWRKHCVAGFDPFKRKAGINEVKWRALKEFYLGRPLRPVGTKKLVR